MGMRRRAVVTAFTGLLMAGSASVAYADGNDNVADPPMVCGSAPLSLTGQARPCVTDQQVKQRVVKHGTQSTDVIDYAVVIAPLDVPVG
ncbi:hypothetical protein [Streptomyces boncukensis]|uniref:Secreted protein n=1 Tax=Streptomyces boncukensis TaxID=2711219 RepID=A0A6G4X6T8_9ACTN|nr:hypothetical protein [Streptomyces boncukensis]NGO72464.1 hypothetical protein [Streptomyces boncukensis]